MKGSKKSLLINYQEIGDYGKEVKYRKWTLIFFFKVLTDIKDIIWLIEKKISNPKFGINI
jgi:hypothetical protein